MAVCLRPNLLYSLPLRPSQPFPVGLRVQSAFHFLAPSGRIRWYATHSDLGSQSSSRPSRKQITVLSDDGTYKWAELSGREKVARATQQSFNFLLVALGVVMTGGVCTFLYLDVFSPNSKTRQFDIAVDRIRNDPRCTTLLGEGKKIAAYGESTWSKWVRNRPIATKVDKDELGREHLVMRFNVEGPLNRGVVHLHMVRPAEEKNFQYRILALDVPGHPRIFLERNSDSSLGGKKSPLKIFGIRWR
ncbi:hypothetical protein VTN31DRAFT_4193 [Thermomyces dupontii]|uniref:uncharacterized protein n=1 Tax=Talaromyces thermophilus TaxID=28565 RepID=UPI003743EDC9